MLTVKFRRLREDAILPRYAHPGDAGMDMFAVEEMTLAPGEWKLIPTGVAMELPEDAEAQVRPRSGLAARYGVTVLNSPGTVDAGYRGELRVILINHGKEDFHIAKGDRIAQMILARVEPVRIEEAEVLSDSDRGTGGFGSTGR